MMVRYMWQKFRGWGGDTVGLSDTGLEKGGTKASQYTGGCSGEVQCRVAEKHWGGGRKGMVWGFAQGIRTARGSGVGLVESEALIASSPDWRGRARLEFEDKRGWGRYVGMMIDGARGVRRSVCVISVHGPSEGRGDGEEKGGVWARQDLMMKEMRRRREGCVRGACLRGA